MKRTSLNSLFCLSLSALILAGCGGDNSTTDNNAALLDGGPAELEFNMQLASSANGALAKLMTKENDDGSFTAANSGVTITAAKVNVKEFELYLPYGISCEQSGFVPSNGITCEEEMEQEDGASKLEAKINIAGPFLVDLINGTSEPAIARISVPSGKYRKIRVRIDDSSALGDKSLVASGTFVDTDGTHNFELGLKFNENIQIKDLCNVEVSEKVLNRVTLALDVEKWFSGVDLAQCLVDGDLTLVNNTLTIDDDSGLGECSDIEKTIKDNIEDSFDLDHDDDDHNVCSDDSNDDLNDDNGGNGNDDGPNHQ